MKSSNKPTLRLARSTAATLAALAGLAGLHGQAQAAATIIINNINAAGVGFNDTTAATPVGGNTGVTIGEQRLIAFTYAANKWAATITSSVPIVINAQFSALTCSATSAVLGSAGATQVFRDFPNAPVAATWYSYALANKLAAADLDTSTAPTLQPQINANFNANLGTANCLPGSAFYLGLDGNHGANIDFIATLMHEMGHGLGFQTFTSGSTGNTLAGFPAIWDHFLLDKISGKLWKDATPAERVASAIGIDKLVWTGANVTAAAPSVLRQGLPTVTIGGPAAGGTAGVLSAGEASFGAALSTTPVAGKLMPVVDQANGTGLACTTLSAANAAAVRGNIAMIDRGTCNFSVKAKNAQDAGAIGVVFVNNTGTAPAAPGGTDATVTIPVAGISLPAGSSLREALKKRSRTSSGVTASLGLTGTQLAGADSLGRVLMYTPNPFQSGSSVSHYDTSATRNLLMEPAINGDLTQGLVPPLDLTFTLFKDIGW